MKYLIVTVVKKNGKVKSGKAVDVMFSDKELVIDWKNGKVSYYDIKEVANFLVSR